jgi:hypothetical protein
MLSEASPIKMQVSLVFSHLLKLWWGGTKTKSHENREGTTREVEEKEKRGRGSGIRGSNGEVNMIKVHCLRKCHDETP